MQNYCQSLVEFFILINIDYELYLRFFIRFVLTIRVIVEVLIRFSTFLLLVFGSLGNKGCLKIESNLEL